MAYNNSNNTIYFMKVRVILNLIYNIGSQKEQYVKDTFNSIAPKYDGMNSMMSLGIHYFWRKSTVKIANVPMSGKILDVCCGTGLITMDLARKAGPAAKIIGLDFSESMLNIAKLRLKDFILQNKIELIQANATAIPFPDNTFDCVTIGYGLRNASNPRLVLKEINRVIKPGGKVVSLELVKPNLPIIKHIYDSYLHYWIPLLGKILVHNKDAYQYLHESIFSFMHHNELSDMYQELGFVNVQCFQLTLGIAVIHSARKPSCS
jgi:demethylmenaquinone methyltransferase / 2-methoxy-6-polyprenyl-1,4-benzoquinol methylase